MTALESINVRRITNHITDILRKTVQKSNPFVSDNLDLAGRQLALSHYKNDIMAALNRIRYEGALHSFKVTHVGSDIEGRLCAKIVFQPTRAAQIINVNIAFEILVNSVFYLIKIEDEWHTCTLKDVYDPGYVPMFAVIGDSRSEYKIHTVKEFEESGMPIDDVRITASNIKLNPE